MIKIAETTTQKERVTEYMLRKGYQPHPMAILYYVDNPNGDIIGAYGIELKAAIEPFCCDNSFIGHELITDAKAMLRTLGYGKINVLTKDPETEKHLLHNEDSVIWGEGLKEIIIYLK